MDREDTKILYDDSEEMWELYRLGNSRIKYTKLKDVDLSADTVFNFNGGKCEYFKQIIEHDSSYNKEEKDCFEEMLGQCATFHHSPQNYSTMIKTGGLNNFKQGLANDRFDVFLNEIDRYFNGESFLVLENGSSRKMCFENRCVLEKTMNSLNKNNKGLEEFAKIFYHLEDEEFLNKLLDSGKKRIDNCNSLFRYMCLAFEYWIRPSPSFAAILVFKPTPIPTANAIINN